MKPKAKKTEDNAVYGTFVIGGMDFSTIKKINEAIGYLLVVEVAWGNLLMEIMGCTAVKERGIHYGTVRESVQLLD